MARKIFVNLPVKDLKRSVDFFAQLGFKFDARFTDENATCMIVDENICVMLLLEPFFRNFTQKEIADASRYTEVIVSLTTENRAEVDETVRKAVAAGASTPTEAKDFGFMYQHGFQDPDGHLWEVFYMDPNAANQQPQK